MPQHVALPTLEITKLRVSGFKSFSEPVELQLEAGLTGIVGPNGCGKSNIVEALRWAMGEGSAKGLRGDAMDDVIFNGSATRPAHDVAEVRLKLRGKPEGLAGFAEEGELEVARRIGRGTGSVYRLNGREVRARDIQLLFADAGAGSRGPAIIGQGQIGFIVDSRPVDRRRLLEEAAGIGGLQGRRREAELRLEATNANLQRVLDLLVTQEARLAELTKQSRQAHRYRQLAADLRVTETQCLLARYSAAAHQAAAANAAVADAGAAHERQQADVAERRRARDALAAVLPVLRDTVAATQVRMTELRERLAGLRESSTREAAHLAAVERQRDEAATDFERAERTAGELAAAAAALAAELAEVAHDRAMGAPGLAQLADADTAAAADLASAQAALREALAHSAEGAARSDAARSRAAALQARLVVVRRGLDELPEVDAVRSRLAEAEVRAHSASQALEQAKADLARAEEELKALVPTREARRVELLTAERIAADCRERLAAEESRLRELRGAVARLAERRASCDRAAARLAERRSAHDSRAEVLAGRGSEADVAAREGELAAAESTLTLADAVLDQAREALSAAEHARTEAAAALRDQRRSADALEAEIRVLESLAPSTIDGGLLDRIEVPGSLTGALAAALGDDLLAGTEAESPRFWREPSAMELAPLPQGATPLLQLVQAPDVLAARLAQIGLIDAEQAGLAQALLKPGQRLVSSDGGLWRWDGFVRNPGAEDIATARVRHKLRLHAAREERGGLLQTLAAQDELVAAAEQELQGSRERLGEAEGAWRAADGAQLQARQRVADAVAAARRLGEEMLRLQQEGEALTLEAAELEVERHAIEALG
ncbi:MAG: AAA family ATPase, partial [Geminicoccaceae bacterium]